LVGKIEGAVIWEN